jgi:hypothetical protein
VTLVGISLALLGGYIVLSQVVLWLKSGHWVSIHLLYLVTDPWPSITGQFSIQDLQVIVPAAQGTFSNPFFILGLGSHIYLDGFSAWIAEPDQWMGLHGIVWWMLDLLPVSLICVVLAALVGIPGMLCAAAAEDAPN